MAAEISVTLAVTGHRPDKLGGWKTPNPIYHQVIQKLRETFEMFKPTLVITGMALGVDQWAAQVCIDLGIPFYAAIPFQDQDKIWPQAAKAKYQYLLSRAAGATIVSPGEYAAYKLQVRNQWMVDRCHQLIAVWNGTDGGTANCVAYASKIQRPIYFVPLDYSAITPTQKFSPPPNSGAQQSSSEAALGEAKEKPFSFKKEIEAPEFQGRILDLDE